MPPIGHIPSPAATSEQVRKSRFLSLGRGKLSPHRLRLRRENLAAADARKAGQAEQAFLVIGRALGARLHLDDLPLAGEDEISRSEEHTSELQSLMRISYAVFCLKKTKQK